MKAEAAGGGGPGFVEWMRIDAAGDDVFAIAWSPDGSKIAAAGEADVVRVWDAETGRVEGARRDSVSAIAWDPAGGRVAIGRREGDVRLRDVGADRVWDLDPDAARGDVAPVTAMAWSTGSGDLALGRRDGIVCIVSRSREGTGPTLRGHSEVERIVLLATREDFLKHEIALREHAVDGPRLISPAQLVREHPRPPVPDARSTVFTFDGPLANIYATLAVRLAGSGLFRRRESDPLRRLAWGITGRRWP